MSKTIKLDRFENECGIHVNVNKPTEEFIVVGSDVFTDYWWFKERKTGRNYQVVKWLGDDNTNPFDELCAIEPIKFENKPLTYKQYSIIEEFIKAYKTSVYGYSTCHMVVKKKKYVEFEETEIDKFLKRLLLPLDELSQEKVARKILKYFNTFKSRSFRKVVSGKDNTVYISYLEKEFDILADKIRTLVKI